MSDSKISFSREIAESIGLGEAIILEQINQSSLLNKTSSLDNICSNLSFIKCWRRESISPLLPMKHASSAPRIAMKTWRKPFMHSGVQPEAKAVSIDKHL